MFHIKELLKKKLKILKISDFFFLHNFPDLLTFFLFKYLFGNFIKDVIILSYVI